MVTRPKAMVPEAKGRALMRRNILRFRLGKETRDAPRGVSTLGRNRRAYSGFEGLAVHQSRQARIGRALGGQLVVPQPARAELLDPDLHLRDREFHDVGPEE